MVLPTLRMGNTRSMRSEVVPRVAALLSGSTPGSEACRDASSPFVVAGATASVATVHAMAPVVAERARTSGCEAMSNPVQQAEVSAPCPLSQVRPR